MHIFMTVNKYAFVLKEGEVKQVIHLFVLREVWLHGDILSLCIRLRNIGLGGPSCLHIVGK